MSNALTANQQRYAHADTADRDRLTKRDTQTEREGASQNASMGANSFSVINCKLFNAFVAMSSLSLFISLSLCLSISRFVPLTLTLIKLCSCFGHSYNKQLQLSALNGCINAKRYFFSPSLCFSFSLSVTHSMLGCLVDKLSSIYMVCVVAGCQTTDKSLFTLLNAI